MKRLTYIFWLAPLLVLLSCGQLIFSLLGNTILMLIVVSLLIIITWGVVWMRLYTAGRLRPEFAILSILPHSVYYYASYYQSKLFQEMAWQNVYGFIWLAFLIIIVISLRPGKLDGKRIKVAKDSTFILTSILTLLYTVSTFNGFAAKLFNII